MANGEFSCLIRNWCLCGNNVIMEHYCKFSGNLTQGHAVILFSAFGLFFCTGTYPPKLNMR